MKNLIFVFALLFSIGTFANCADDANGLARAVEQVQVLPAVPPFKEALTALTKNAAELTTRDQLWELYSGLLADIPQLREFFPEDKIRAIALDLENSTIADNLGAILKNFKESKSQKSLEEKFKVFFQRLLRNRVPEATIETRIAEFLAKKENSLKRILGDMELNEVQLLYYGKDPHNPSPESLIGQYVKRTGVKTFVKQFPVEPGSNQLGPKRLIIPISEQTFEVYKQLFTRKNHFSVFNHAYVLHNAKVSSYMRTFDNMRIPNQELTPFPVVLLKTTEGDRLEQLFKLFEQFGMNGDWNNSATQPWRLEGYCATGGYTNCTHWIGNAPIGDTLVNNYHFPPNFEWGGDRQIRTQILAPYKSDDPLIKRIWKVPGNQQLAATLGMEIDNLNGNFASPGWVITSLLGPAPQERVPAVFVVVKDHKAELPQDFVPIFEHP